MWEDEQRPIGAWDFAAGNRIALDHVEIVDRAVPVSPWAWPDCV
jgi:hypothetical protein